MPNTTDLLQLTRWCSARHLNWQPARTEEGQPAILLRSQIKQRPWEDMLLVESDDEITLINETGDLLASASELPALLDALDSGLMTSPFASSFTGPVAMPPYAGVFSDTKWNSVGVGMT